MSKQRFITWLKAQHNRDDSVGDLSRDVLDDNTKPMSLKTLKDSMAMRSACTGAQEALEKAIKEYSSL